jgi:hypothetical protein
MATVLLFPVVVNGADRYVFTNYVVSGATIEREAFTVVVPESPGDLRAFKWRHFDDRREPRNVIINLGAGKNFSWAATVRAKAPLAPAETVADRAASVYPRETYSELKARSGNTRCVTAQSAGNDDKGFERFYEYVAICAPEGQTAVYELILSEMNFAGKDESAGLHQAATEFFRSLRFR